MSHKSWAIPPHGPASLKQRSTWVFSLFGELADHSPRTLSQIGGCSGKHGSIYLPVWERWTGAHALAPVGSPEERRSGLKNQPTRQESGCLSASLVAFWVLILFTAVKQANKLFPGEDSLLKRSPRLKVGSLLNNWASAQVFATSNLLSFELKLKLWYLFFCYEKAST